MHCQRDMDGRKAEGEKIVKERRRVKLFRCAMMERRRWSGQMRGGKTDVGDRGADGEQAEGGTEMMSCLH